MTVTVHSSIAWMNMAWQDCITISEDTHSNTWMVFGFTKCSEHGS